MDQFIANGWLKPRDRVLTVEQLKRKDPGTRIRIVKPDRYGEMTSWDCLLVQSGNKKVLTCWDGYGERVVMPIRKADNIRYVEIMD